MSAPSVFLTLIDYFRGVPIFFVLSGFLIWKSIGRSGDFRSYIKKRFWRIYPELWICVAIEILSIVIFYRGWNIRDLSLFTITQGTILQFWTPDSLRGYGCGTPNGTLWTICVTIQFYLVSWAVYKALHKRNIRIWLFSFIGLVSLSVIGQLCIGFFNREVLTKLYSQTVLRYGWLFLAGCFLAEFNTMIMPTLSRCWYIPLAFGLIPYFLKTDLNTGYGFIQCLLMTTGLIGFAFRFPMLALEKDISYAVFLYQMIVVNIFISVGWTEQWIYGLIAIVLSFAIAYISTVTIGTWAGKQRITEKS